MNKPETKPYIETLKALSYVSQLGVRIAACVFIGVFIGRFLDNILNTSPWLLLFFALMGVAASLKIIIDGANQK